jgi:hypothetical protein
MGKSEDEKPARQPARKDTERYREVDDVLKRSSGEGSESALKKMKLQRASREHVAGVSHPSSVSDSPDWDDPKRHW